MPVIGVGLEALDGLVEDREVEIAAAEVGLHTQLRRR
jgi:hypothetical protein